MGRREKKTNCRGHLPRREKKQKAVGIYKDIKMSGASAKTHRNPLGIRKKI
jgi:hypothetical protein